MAAIWTVRRLLQSEERRIPRSYFQNRFDAFDLHDEIFIKLFRVDKHSVLYVCKQIEDFMPSSRIPLLLKVLTALRFCATGSYQSPVGNDIYIMLSQQSVSRCIRDVSKAIYLHLVKKFIQLPRTTEEISSLKQNFFSEYGFPGIIGAIDCTHIAIVSPSSADATVYINRKGYTSINVQLIVGPDLMIKGISARYPGSVHDFFIWRNSAARRHISQLNAGWLIGDNGYPLERWLLTPFLNAQTDSLEDVYNRRLSSARACVERCNGVLKGRFRCLLKDRVLHYSPTIAGHIIYACAVLHNMCILRKISFHEVMMVCQMMIFSVIIPALWPGI